MPRGKNRKRISLEIRCFSDDRKSIRGVRVDQSSIAGFGIVCEKVFTTNGTFKEFNQIGYFYTSAKKYYMSKGQVSDFRKIYKHKVNTKEVLIEYRDSGKEVKGINWDYIRT